MSEDFTLQASVKTKNGTLINVRHSDPDTFKDAVEWLTTKLKENNFVGDLEDALAGATVPQAVSNVQAAIPGTAPVQQQGNQTPTCKHGPMKDLQAKNYKKRWYCSGPFNAPDKCDPRD